MLDLQDRLNVLEDPEWEKKNHLREAWISTGALVVEVESGNSNFVSPAFVRVWRSLMSEWLKHIPKDETLGDAAALFISTLYEERFWSKTQQATLDKYTDLPPLADAFVHMCAAGMFNAHLFERMMELWNMSWDDMFDLVVPEGVADVFTSSLPAEVQINSHWVFDWAMDTMDSSDTARPVVELLNTLEQAYVAEAARRGNAMFDPEGK